MTYYRNYTSKEDVFQKYMDEIVEEYRQEAEKLEKGKCYGEYENILQCFQYFVRYKEFIKCIVKIGMQNLLFDALSSYLQDTYYKGTQPSVEQYYLLCAYEGSLLSVYMAWLENGEKESVGTLADILYKHTWQ